MAQQRSVADLEKQLKALETTIAKQAVATDAQVAAQKRITKELELQKSLQEESLSTNKEIDDTLKSIASSFGKQNKIYKRTEAQLNLIEKTIQNSLDLSKEWKNASSKNRELLETQAKKYKNINAQSLKNISLLGQGKAEQHEIIDALQDQIDLHEEALQSIDAKAKHSKKFKEEIQGEIDAMKKLQQATKSAAKDVEAINRMGSAFGGTMLGGGIDKTLKAFGKKDGLGGVIKSVTDSRTAASGGGGVGGMFSKMLGGVSRFLGPIALAVGGIMAAAEFFDSGGAAKMAMRMAVLQGNDPMNNANVDKAMKQSKGWRDLQVEKYYKTPLKLQQQSENDYLEYKIGVEDDAAKYKESLIRDEIDYRFGLEADAIQFRQQQASMELDAQLSRQKTLFTSGMGYMKQAIGISERALMAIGSSTAAVLDTVKEYGYTLGIALKDQIALSAAAQGLGVRYGTSATEVFKMADTFRLMNKSSAKVGANLVAGLEVLAKDNDMSPAQLYKEMADAQADILKYSSYTTEEYARQAIQLGNMNTSMASMMKASDSMVLNYKDSIKAEMSLSAMLGKNVNLSEVRAKLMSGDQAGGAAALKTALGGQDINAMNAFQKQALSQATGMGIQELMQLTQSKGDGKVKGSLEERNALKTGKAIANGALQQDIANAAAKLALDQKNRAEMLKFEQAKRMAMLFVEQKFKLNAIEREIKYRKDREEQNQKVAEENYKMSLMGDVASEQIMQLSSAYTDAKNAGKISEAQLSKFKAETIKSQDVLQQAMAKGFIQDSEIADITLKRFEAAQKGEMFDITKIAGVQKYQGAYAVEAQKQNDNNAKMIATFDAFVKKEFDSNTSSVEQSRLRDEIKKLYPEMAAKYFEDTMFGRSYTKDKASAFLTDMKKRRAEVSLTPGGASTTPTINKPTPVTVVEKKTSSTKPETKTTPIDLPKDAPKLSDTQAQTKLQVQMVKLMGVSAQFLAQIDANTTAAGTVKIDGKPLSQALLNQVNRTYGIAGASY
jgi:hypothetical protein